MGYGNRFYLDEINFSGPVGINELVKDLGISVFPNPSNGEFTIDLTLSDEALIKYELVSAAGAILEESDEEKWIAGSHKFLISKKLSPGMYFLNLYHNGSKACRKLIIQ